MRWFPAVFAMGLLLAAPAPAARPDVFAFAQMPRVAREGDKVTVSFAVKEYCDATVAIEDAHGTIVRHLASGLLGDNAPPPFRKKSLKQSIVWDGKNDKEEYVDNVDSLAVRVSLGLKPRLERSLYWSPYKLGSGAAIRFCAAPEGVYVYDPGPGRGSSTPWLKLFDRDGRYVHTLYPFPAADLEKVKGLNWVTYPPDGRKYPLKHGLGQCTLLPMSDAGNLCLVAGKHYVYMIGSRIQRIAKPGSGKPSILDGPELKLVQKSGSREFTYEPAAAALSPDGRWLYLTAYRGAGAHREYYSYPHDYLPCVMRMPADLSAEPEVLIGGTEIDRAKAPSKPPKDSLLALPTDVTCDAKGRLYVTDADQNALFVFSPNGKLLHRSPIEWPMRVHVAPDTGDIWITCWRLKTALTFWAKRVGGSCSTPPRHVHIATVHRLTPCKGNVAPRVVEGARIPVKDRANLSIHHNAVVDVFAPTARLWFAQAKWPYGGPSRWWEFVNAKIYEVKDRKLAEIANFDALTKRAVVQSRPPRYGRQRPYANPADGCVYVAEQIQPTVVADVQCFDQLVKIDPRTGRASMVGLPFDTEDLAFHPDGFAYLRTESVLTRYDSRTWREVPFDYGEEMPGVTHYGLHPTDVVAGTFFHGGRGASGKLGGMGVNAGGDIACWYYSSSASTAGLGAGSPGRKAKINIHKDNVKPWKPQVSPGRGTSAFIHIWDRHGKILYEDAVPGIAECTDIEMDKNHDLYLLAGAIPQFDGKRYPNPLAGSLVKVHPGKAKILTAGPRVPVKLTPQMRPKRPPDWTTWNSKCWIENGEWIYGGVGGSAAAGICKCHCEANSGMALDYYGRSFAPAYHRFDVVVIDSAGNEIVRIGRYGNVDDGVPLVKDGGPSDPHAIGGDEVAFVSPKWMSVHSDRRLFVADRGNYRVTCVKLGYHTEEKVALGSATDAKD